MIGVRSPIVIDVSADAGPLDLDSYLSSLDAESMGSATSFVFRVTSELNSRLAANEGATARAELLRRVTSGVPLQSLTLEADTIKLFHISEHGLTSAPPTEIPAVQQADLRRLVEQHQDLCYYQSNPKHHYVAPSTRHCTAFFRLGDVIRSRDALDRLAFWLRPYISASDAILVDTWSIAALVIRALQLQQRDIPFDCLGSHPQQDRSGAEVVVTRLIRAMKQGGQLTCIVSVTSSGRYGQIIAEMCSGLEIENVRTIAIYTLAGVPNTVEALCQLALNPTNYPPDACPLCDKGSTAITLHPGLYYLKNFPERALVLNSSYFLPSQPAPQQVSSQPIKYDPFTFTSLYQTVDLFSVHRDDRHKRHHAFHVDVGKLLDQSPFSEKFDAKLDSLTYKPDVIITTSDDVSTRMGERASRRLGCPRVTVDSFRHLEKLTPEERSLVQGQYHFLILDDVLVSGSRLSLLNTELRERNEPPAGVAFLVGLGRPPSARDWKKHELALTSRVPWLASLDAVETIFLPNWDEKHCPWCRESEFL